ncbi:APC family permease [Chryseolinea lacunae]|uniref:Arginine/agmatine antiporter n=1 Tax=Chryseolinea lacunae TaxID=2801331 RepID=A0ABS1KNR7_9BACT|nr:amino acid permease [Chryseolinea lacunae]MBL0739896.1 amino acid permease [Chryseolinea lacunae]
MESSGEGLNRAIGIKSLAASVVNLTVGAGIFVLPALVAEKLGHASTVAYLICGALIFMIMMCFAEVGSQTSTSGGIYKYVESAFGPYVGFLTSNLYWFGFGMISDAAIANALFEMIALYVPDIDTLFGRLLFFLLVFGLLAWINVRGVKYGAKVISVLTLAKLLPIALLLFFGWPKIDTANLSVWGDFEFNHLGEACLILFFAFVGGEAALTTGGEIRNPKRSVPLGLLSGIVIVILIYLGIQVLAQGILGADLSLYKEAPLARIATVIFGSVGPTLIVLATALAILGAISGDILAMPRFLFASSKDKLIPDMLSSIHPRFRTPYISIITYSFLAFVLSLSGSFKGLAILSSSANLITYFAVVLSLWKLKKNDRLAADESGIRVPVFLIPLILITMLWLLSHLSIGEYAALFIFLLLCSLYYFRKALALWLKKILVAQQSN